MGAPASANQAKGKTNADYHELLGKLQDIPTLPMVAMRVNELINDPTSSSAQIAELLKKDQVLTAKILRQGYRIYEVPISYAGREFDEGKKITWRDGVVALWVLLKYRFTE